jgi:hypothetical protein
VIWPAVPPYPMKPPSAPREEIIVTSTTDTCADDGISDAERQAASLEDVLSLLDHGAREEDEARYTGADAGSLTGAG